MGEEEVKVGLVLLVKDKKILVTSRKDNHYDFNLIGGKMEKSDKDSFIETAIRECKEETGLDISKSEFIELVDLYYMGNRCITYLVEDYKGEIKTDENIKVKWGTPEDLMNGSFSDYNYKVIEAYMDYKDKEKLIKIEK